VENFERVAIIGVGLVGGSIGPAIRERRLARETIGIGRRLASLAIAQDRGAVDRVTTMLSDGVRDCDLVVVATPVGAVVDTVLEAARYCAPGSLISDGGSTKAKIVEELDRRLGTSSKVHFVGSHPLAGDHRTGPVHARADLFVDRTVVVTPTTASDHGAVVRTCQLWRGLGARVVTMLPDEHDRKLAATSHLPHLVASALAATTPEDASPLAAGGWRDTTRVAASDPALWRPIFATNRQHVLDALDHFEHTVARFRRALATSDDAELEALLREAKRVRDVVGN
jgi:prephenate dehydrogenase